MYHLATETNSLRMVMLLAAVVMLAGWMIALCESHGEECGDCSICALPCCQTAVLSSDQVFATSLEVTGMLPTASQTAYSYSTDPLFRPPQA